MFGLAGSANAGDVRDNIEDRGYLRCGVVQTSKFPVKDMGEDLCRGLALALFPDPKAVKLVSLTQRAAGQELAVGRVDVVALANRTSLSHQGGHVNAGSLFVNSLDIAILFKGYKVRDLSGKKICSLDWVDKTELAIFGQKHQVSFGVLSYKTEDELLQAVKSHGCRAVALPRVEQAIFLKKVSGIFPTPFILSSISSSNNLGMLVSSDDEEWKAIVRLYTGALLESERRGIHSQNVDYIASSTVNPDLQKLLGVKGSFGEDLGLDNNWFYRVLQSYGNYEEIYMRHFNNGDIMLERGPNQLTTKGGVLTVDGLR
ncbi:hypothetical protein WH96_07550 [Kiloniella spongiae]|uniref:Solute-binding protein family 3/N-terminal domain-containing protein n=1 Tax=Kiloniella spongiae TaxID=1489064 RepID=A0A0H2MGI2_9PROT|nr:hypothetical protein WH96_07550 [Kiloniella spongiae]